MASNVVVIDSSFRRTTIKVHPQTYLNDVLAQACSKFGLRAELYGLKYNKKQLDLSLTHRLSGLPSGAQLELVQSSRSPTVVNVALQFPQSENNLRLTEKFPSSTSLWQILRRFETGVAGGTPYPLNITQRGVAQTEGGNSGSGRLYYEMPVLSLMNREFGSFTDLQKTLAQVGVTSGSSLLRLNFKNSGKPLEEAMLEITQYFKEHDAEEVATATASDQAAQEAASKTSPVQAPLASNSQVSSSQADVETMDGIEPAPSNPSSKPTQEPPTATPSSRIEVFQAPSGAPLAATIPHNENDYIPTIDHAKLHQARLTTYGQNQRLPSDAELEAAKKEREQKATQVNKVRVRYRLPDQTQIQTSFTLEDTVQNVFAILKDALRYPNEPYTLGYRDMKGKQTTLDPAGKQKLIQTLGWTGDTLVHVTWGEAVPEQAKKEPCLNDEHMKLATQLKVEVPKEEEEESTEKKGFLGGLLGGGKDKGKGKAKMNAADREEKLKRMMGFGKK